MNCEEKKNYEKVLTSVLDSVKRISQSEHVIDATEQIKNSKRFWYNCALSLMNLKFSYHNSGFDLSKSSINRFISDKVTGNRRYCQLNFFDWHQIFLWKHNTAVSINLFAKPQECNEL